MSERCAACGQPIVDGDLRDELRDELIAARDDVPTIADWTDVVDDALLPIISRRIAQARAETAEQLRAAIEATWTAALRRMHELLDRRYGDADATDFLIDDIRRALDVEGGGSDE